MLLSICIPTHDGRDWCLSEAIDSALAQIVGKYEGEIEIAVSDNGSRDTTSEVLAQYMARYPGIFVLHRFEENQGGHNNFLKVVEIASGDYCWLLGSDDRLYPGALDTVMSLLRRNPQVAGLTFDYRSFDRTLTLEEPAWTSKCLPPHPDEYLYDDNRLALEELGLFLMFMSIHVFRRRDWQDIVAREGRPAVFAYRHFMHVYILGQIMLGGDGWLWRSAALVMYRNYNMSLVEELNSGMHQYFIETSEDIVHCYAGLTSGDKTLYKELVRRYFVHWFSPRTIADWKRRATHTAAVDQAIFQSLSRTQGLLPEFWLRAAPHLLFPESVHKAWVRLGLGKKLLRVTIALAPRTRVRALFRAVGVSNHWTQGYDAHVVRVTSLAEEYQRLQTTVRYSKGFAKAVGNSDAPENDLLEASEERVPQHTG